MCSLQAGCPGIPGGTGGGGGGGSATGELCYRKINHFNQHWFEMIWLKFPIDTFSTVFVETCV